MPRVKRKSKRRRLTGYTEAHVKHLLTGHDFFGEGFRGDRAAMRQAWEALGSDLLGDWINEHPGTRPYAFWVFDAPERRRRIDGKAHPFDNPERQAHVERIAETPEARPDYRETMYQLSYGTPNSLCMRDDFEAEYETELDYLDRLGLLTENERTAFGR
ncbi:MAG: hypothetical protein HQ567_17650 [Candidatus Nealsonbacteria bacterium]|nr:hypothetical protein [Candidatus Nealsonbacteria bacterium]